VALADGRTEPRTIRFTHEGRPRALSQGDPTLEVAGLVELADNNPLVCADLASVPGPVATLALIALGPLVRAGILAEPPAVQVAGASDADDLGPFLAKEGWPHGVALDVGDEDLGTVVALNAIAVLTQPADLGPLFEEAFGRSFYVRPNTATTWDTSLVAKRPFALYDLSASSENLLTVRVMADRDGKCGAAQMVHALNVMCGFEESLGIPT
jgi:N-acetyl-gamma-glutamylphosphate reductase